ncbi:hypothetical protein AB0C65_38255 [Nocardia sp. NPDC048505]|uniref:hypothetical protein n=1 Tax=Nocardia sp. NPDC048505 TaxID=3155756 RepID=UPI0033D49141
MTSTDITPNTPANDLDDAYIARYAGLVANDEEVLMRADFDRMRDLRTASINAASIAESNELYDQADEIRLRWSDREDDLGQAWVYLHDATADWERSPDIMGGFVERAEQDRAEGWHLISGTQWRSQLQAREITGHGQWSAGADFSRFDASPTVPPRSSDPSDPTNPLHYPQCATWTEQVMRADFARIHEIREELASPTPFTNTDAARDQANEIAARWEARADEIGDQWTVLNSLAGWYAESPESLDDAAASVKQARVDNLASVSAPYVRSLDQVRELLTDPGPNSRAWEERAATLSGSRAYPVSAQGARARTRELAGAGSALAGHGGNAFAAGTERDGAER